MRFFAFLVATFGVFSQIWPHLRSIITLPQIMRRYELGWLQKSINGYLFDRANTKAVVVAVAQKLF